MKFYLLSIVFLLSISNFSFSQVSPIDQDKTEYPKINKESLKIETTVELFPNPAVESINVTLKNSNLKEVEFEMYNVIGNKMDFEVGILSAQSYKVNVKDFNPGYYLLIIKDPITRFNKAYKFRKQ